MKELLETGNSGSLGFNEQYNALVGKVDRLSTVIKENDETKSYGCLIWVRSTDGVSDNELNDYLSRQVADMPHVIKHFKATERGAAIALVKYNDPARNMHNISRFLTDLSEDLFAHGYRNCCYSCGKTDDLAVYGNGTSVVQYCAGCAKGEPVRIDLNADDIERMAYEEAERAVIEAAENSVTDEPEEPVDYTEIANLAAEESSIDELFTDGTEAAAEEVPAGAAEIVGAAENIEELSEFMVGDDEDASAGAPGEDPADIHIVESSGGEDLFGLDGLIVDSAATQEAAAAEENGESDEDVFAAIDKELFGTGEAPDKSAEPAFGSANDYKEGPAEDEKKSAGNKDNADNANIYGLMLGTERDLSEKEDIVLEVTELNINGTNRGEDLNFEKDDEDEDVDPNVEVTELYDDSNEGDDFDIEELDGDFNMPTDTSGKQMTASETPLEKDGSVPMVNPTSDFAETKPSSVADKNAVRAFAYGSYDNANTAEEPVRFDGRPKGYKGSDPRMGDEMGSVSRDYSRQNAASFAGGKKNMRLSEQRVVNRGSIYASKSGKSLPNRSYYGSSNAVIGTVAAVLFALIGCAVWVGVGILLGISGDPDIMRIVIMSALGLLPAVGAFVGYRIGGDCYDIKGIVIASVVSVVMDAVGLAAVLISENMQALKAEVGYLISIDKAVNNVLTEISGGISVQIWAAIAVMTVTLVASIIISKKKI